jgi:hypothetical protein
MYLNCIILHLHSAKVNRFYHVIIKSIVFEILTFIWDYLLTLFCVLAWPLRVQVLRLCLCSSCRWSSALIKTWERGSYVYIYIYISSHSLCILFKIILLYEQWILFYYLSIIYWKGINVIPQTNILYLNFVFQELMNLLSDACF